MTSELTTAANELTSNELALRRTIMAAGRSLMAWVRTSLSMISFGFTLYKILEGLLGNGKKLRFVDDPKVVGLVLIGLGLFALLAGLLEYRHTLRELVPSQRYPIFWRPAYGIAILLALLGSLLFFGVLFHAI